MTYRRTMKIALKQSRFLPTKRDFVKKMGHLASPWRAQTRRKFLLD